jgi:hypothetical protein
MTDADFLDQLDAWALGGLDPDSALAMERHLDRHPEHAAAARRAFTVAAALGAALPVSQPPPEVWPRVLATVRSAPGPGPGRDARPASPRRRRVSVGWAVAAVASAVALWLWLDRRDREKALAGRLRAEDAEQRAQRGSTLATQAQLDRCARDLEALRTRDALASEAVALLELAGTQLIPLEPPAPSTDAVRPAANAIYHRGVKKAYVVARGLPADPAGYQVWVRRGGARLPAAVLAPTASGAVIASVATATLDGIPESFEITAADGRLVLRSRVSI